MGSFLAPFVFRIVEPHHLDDEARPVARVAAAAMARVSRAAGQVAYALGLGVALDRERNLATAFRAWERRERPVTEHTQRWTRIYGNTIFLPRVLKRMSIAAERRIPWIGRQYLHAAHVVPTGCADLVGR